MNAQGDINFAVFTQQSSSVNTYEYNLPLVH
jgi:hypothetical protein